MKLLKNKWFFRTLVVFSFISVLVLIGILSWAIDIKKSGEKNEQELKNELEAHVQHENFLIELLEADQEYMDGKYKEALEHYNQLSKATNKEFDDQKLIQFRIHRMDEMLNVEDTSSDVREKIMAYRYTIEQMKMEQDSLLLRKDSLVLGLEQELEEKSEEINTLQVKIKEKEKNLKREERVKVVSFTNEKGKVIHYLGETENGKANGGGVGIWNTGSIYKGDWKDNMRHGQGRYEWADGHIYEGAYIDDKRNGEGSYYWPSGEKYVGEWKDDKRNGEGALYDRDGNVQFEGDWVNDNIVK